ncbi:putative pentatricopeptide repeat-containing protein At3g05240 [Alnus glutinosa]|uniref:putative pentatricopeptide repeat-containing protein At3g05240 n=1 Tax=Alnus glutinosa TaxID=3517 RepID=UPI002D798F13|nr:putative pentatricopeptide repeat-containing protein At3g05240 [Alnus glutinosa]XP_062143669.1 putative pentatricopeptide repeat-containing protein At3g05240 [Alnus glutinosa]
MKKHYTSILSLLDKCRTMTKLKQLHGLMITTSVIKYVIPLSRLIDFCTNSEAGDFNYANSVFIRIEVPSVYIWNSMIKAYSNTNNPDEALSMYSEMQRRGYSPDHFTFPFVLKACSLLTHPNYGTSVHNRIVKTGFESDAYASCGLLNMYVSCADMEAGVKVFDLIPKWNVVAWTSLIAGYVNNGWPSKAIEVFKDMEFWNIEPNEITLVNVLVACAHMRDIDTGKWVHSCVCQLGYDPFESDLTFNVILATAIIDMYGKCGSFRYAKNLFYKMPERNLVVWNSMIGAFNQYGRVEEALGLFFDMLIAGFQPDTATFLSVISACAQLGALALGQSIHAFVLKTNLSEDTAIGTALVDMYAKIGDAGSSQQIFCKMEKKDVMAWTSMIVGLAMHGHGEEALSTFKRMQEDAALIPDEITYIGVLCACSRVGLVEEGQRHFTSMVDVYNMEPTMEHYGCMVDLLSRAGYFEEAERLVKKMPIRPNIAIWGALLNGCDIHENVNLVDQMRSRITELDPEGSGVYVLLSNLYARAGKWQEVKLARELMAHRRVEKTLGHSTVELKLLNS